ncbi:hypothetical protein K3495_g2419 [Podosphaera aphanis]|nr:hypothetical protein K3495_g2419 [Podosphaera aphanis]
MDRLLVCSIGNPAPYTNTFHSAGHVVLAAIARTLGYTFQKGRGGTVALGSEFILWQSHAYMNVSGPAVALARKQYGGRRLVVVHDEMELALGQVRVVEGRASAKGHNGLKSMLTKDYTRIGVGIGRPMSRESHVVAAYVLGKMRPEQRAKIEGCAGRVLEELRKM